MQDLAKKKINIKSPAKINLHLEVIGKREDGFHELAMIMQNIDLADYLEFEINNEGLIKLESDCNDLSLSDDNLIVKSANLLKKKSNIDYGANIFLRKNIPIACNFLIPESNNLDVKAPLPGPISKIKSFSLRTAISLIFSNIFLFTNQCCPNLFF